MHVVKVSISLIIFATLGLTAIILLSTSATTGLTGSTAFLATTFIILMAAIGVAIDFIPGGLGAGMAFNTAPTRAYSITESQFEPALVMVGRP